MFMRLRCGGEVGNGCSREDLILGRGDGCFLYLNSRSGKVANTTLRYYIKEHSLV